MSDEMLEVVAAWVHEAWRASKRAQGIRSRKSESREELMVPYASLSEAAKDLDRSSVRAVLAALEVAGYRVVQADASVRNQPAPRSGT